jgi:serine protease
VPHHPSLSTARPALLAGLVLAAACLPAVWARPADGATLPPHALRVRPSVHRTAPSPTQLLRFRGDPRVPAVIHSPKVYLVFYGRQWGRASTVGSDLHLSGDPMGMAPRLQQFLRGLAGNEHWSTSTTQYCDGVTPGTTVCPTRAHHIGHPRTSPLAGVWLDATYDAVAAPRETSIRAAAARAARHFGRSDAVSNAEVHYMVVMPPRIVPPGFGSQWCAYHSDGTSPAGRITYTALPYVTDAGANCGAGSVHAGTTGRTDGITMVAGHEYVEWLTDPFGTGWTDATGRENADGCAWVDAGPGRPIDLTLSTGTFPVQSLWSNSADQGRGACVTWFGSSRDQH